ncbi:MAG: rRNA-processing protein and EBNA1-binding protein ebp2 [Alectoria sarmentosa]|nr:MAG: rRNA-processing protein and EBNA1-binding protein ebp2 [Alectoria sarmentosa]
MAKKGKLLTALDAHRGRDYNLEKQKKQQKQAAKKKRTKDPESDLGEKEIVEAQANGTPFMPEIESDGWESDESEAAQAIAIDSSRIMEDESDSDSSLGGEDSQELNLIEEAADEEGIPLSDIESLASEDKADILTHQRLTINNTVALTKALKSIAMPSSLPFSSHQSITTSEPVTVPDVNDDLTRELTFYKQCLDAANEARITLAKEGVPFSRPTDYFAEMVKSDEHMGKIRSKMVDEAANKKAAEDARKQRDLKKFGKQVQVAKLQERDKAKRETLDKINLLKRKRKNTDPGAANEEDLFDVALDDAAKEDRSLKSAKGRDGRGRTQNKRQKKDDKHGYGGKKRFSKSTDAASTADLRGFSAKKMKGKKGLQRLGKSRRAKL